MLMSSPVPLVSVGAVRADDGPLELLKLPSPSALQGAAPHVAATPLLYADLLAEDNERAREAAAELRAAYLMWKG